MVARFDVDAPSRPDLAELPRSASRAAAILLAPSGGSSGPTNLRPVTSESADPTSYDPHFQVAAPMLVPVHGPYVQKSRECSFYGGALSARLRATPNGVFGVISMKGSDCSIPLTQGPTALLDADGNRLDVPLVSDSFDVNGPANARPDISFAHGEGYWGFAWRGSWCGPRAAAVEMVLPDDDPVAVPLAGPQPACLDGNRDAALVPGLPGGSSDAVLTPPPAWSALRLEVHVPPGTSDLGLAHVNLTIHNQSETAVSFDPCPRYSIVLHAESPARGDSYESRTAALDCSGAGATIPAHGERDYILDPLSGAEDHITAEEVMVAIAGVPTAIGRVTASAV